MTILAAKAQTHRQGLAAALAVCAALAAGAPSALAADAVIDVKLDDARVVALPKNVKTLIIGNPVIADVTMLKGGDKMVVTGKSYGQTNLIALDNDGRQLGETTLRVDVGHAKGSLLVQRGGDRETYFCNPLCHPTITLGDGLKYTGDIAGQISTRNGLAGGTGAPAAK